MAVGVVAIDKLKLDEAFQSGINTPFNDCWCIRMDSQLMLVDDDALKYSRFSDNAEEEQKAFLIINAHNKEIVLLAIDNKLLTQHVGGIADCAIFDEELFKFVEFKTNAYGNSEESVRDTFDKAISQLKETYNVFEDRLSNVNIDFSDAVVVTCHIVVSHSFPKSKAVKQEYQLAFTDETGLELSFSEKISW